MNTTKLFFLLVFCTIYSTVIFGQDFVTHDYKSVPGGDGYSAVGDMDGDGNIDIVTNSVDKMHIYYHDGTSPINLKSTSIVPISSYRAVISLSDMDGDGDLDILASRNDKLIIITNNSTPGNFSFEILPLSIDFTTNYPNLIGADFDNDGKMDILVGDNSGRIKVFYNRNTTFIEYEVDYIKPSPEEANLSKIKVADFNNDGKLDIVAGSLFAQKKGLMLYFNEGQSFKPLVISEKYDYRDMQVVDFDKDGDIDILISGEQGVTKYQIDLWINDLQLNNKFEFKNLLNRPWYYEAFNVLDIDSDGDYDLIVKLDHHSDLLPGSLSAFISNGNINELAFTEIKVLDFSPQADVEVLLLADMDNDGDQDFIHGTRKIWIENRLKATSTPTTEYFQNVITYPNPASDYIQFNNTKPMDTNIWSSTGSLVSSKRVQPNESINISNLPSGLYFVTLDDESGRSTSLKFVKGMD
ncbi:MAG: T9SS type A sorting domain-containing protein [Saprospiraceae bacterium]